MSLSRRFSYSRGGKFGGAMDTYIRKFVVFARISPSGIGPRLSEPQLQRPLRGFRGTWTRVVQSKPLRLGEPRSFGSGCAGLRGSDRSVTSTPLRGFHRHRRRSPKEPFLAGAESDCCKLESTAT